MNAFSMLRTYRPLLILISIILLGSFAATWPSLYPPDVMRLFMAGFFLAFAALKLLDLKGFAHGYAKYDLLAKEFPAYGYAYPFLELTLGLLLLSGEQPEWTAIATLSLMSFSALGVLRSLWRKERFKCACMGTIINVPLTSVALVEDLAMAVMAGVMLA